MTRNPPPSVQRALAQEVGFGCPVDDCNSPYLTWHHFDPPWAEREHHDPEGMVALCVFHHGQADAGAFSQDQLRAFKDSSRNSAESRVRGRFHWRRDRLVLLAGGNWWTGCEVLVQCGPLPIIWLTRDEDGFELLNLDLYDDRGVPRLQMRNNFWSADRDVDDLICPPKKALLDVTTETLGARLLISFARATPAAVTAHAARVASAGYGSLPERVRGMVPPPEEQAARVVEKLLRDVPEDDSALCVIEGKLRWPVEIALEPHRTVLPKGNVLSGTIIVGSKTGLQGA